MLKYHVVLNACGRDVNRQARELNGFIRKHCFNSMEQGNTIIICDGKQDGDDKQRLTDLAPTSSVILVVQDYYQPEAVLELLAEIVSAADLYLFGSNYSGWELAVRLGCRTGGSSIQGCTEMAEAGCGGIIAEKMAYSNHMKGTYLLTAPPFCIAAAKGQEEAGTTAARHELVKVCDLRGRGTGAAVRLSLEAGEDSGSLADAAFILVAGRGIGRKEAAARLSGQAGRIGAAFGASRPVVMNAWAPVESLVGVSGAMLKPEICIAAGVSGAPALYAGIEKSKFIVAVNSDERAPIMKKADVAVVGDCQEIVAELVRLIEGGED